MDKSETLTSESMYNITKDMEFWMTNLPQKLRSIPITQLAIPGSHDSITYGITSKSDVSPDAEPIIQNLKFLGPVLKSFMVDWSRTQSANTAQQLKSGIRYFDFRIATKAGIDQFYFVHGLYSVEVSEVLEQLRDYLDTHPREVVILDCQHFYAFQQSDHDRLMCLLTSTFSHKMVPYAPHMEHLSLQYMTTQFRYQVIVIYRSDAARFGQPLLWPASCFPTPWADTMSVTKLITFLDDGVKKRNDSVGFVSQCILTPAAWDVVKHLFSSVKSQCFIPLEKQKYKWLTKQKPGRGGINIVISDCIDYQDSKFPKAVVGLNQKLLEAVVTDEVTSALTPVDSSD